MDYDVIIIGAGTGGTTASKITAQSGLKTCLIDQKAINQVGDKICGDGIEEWDIKELGINYPKQDEILNRFEFVDYHPPNPDIRVTIREKGYILNRYKYGQRLLKECTDIGIDFLEKTRVIHPIFSNKSINGIVVKRNGNIEELRAKVIIDASGFHSIIRKSIESSYTESIISKEDYWVCYREVLEFNKNEFNSKHVSVFLFYIPKGYTWFFPRTEKSANIGIAVRGNISIKIKEAYRQFLREVIFPKTGEPKLVISKGGGMVPVRHPLWSLVENNILFVGDAGCQVNPMHGGGIVSSMRAGKYAGEIVSSIKNDDYSINNLWEYNKIYANKSQGSIFASLHILRILLSQLSKNELNTLMKSKIILGTDIFNLTSKGDLRTDFIRRLLRGILYPEIMLKLWTIFQEMRKIKSSYSNFPSIDNFYTWKKEITKIYERADRYFK